VKVCPHCAEELPDDAAVCPQCGKDPTEVPAWATAGRSDESRLWAPDDHRPQPGRDEGIPESVPAPYRGLEPAAGQRLGVPWKVWASLILALTWGYVASFLVWGWFVAASPASGLPYLVLPLAGYTVGLILGNLGRAEVDDSDRVGQILGWGGIGLNALRIFLLVFSIPAAILSGLS
jgi:zinc-ribbon domain